MFSNLTIRKKLVVLSVVILILISGVGVKNIYKTWGEYNNIQDTQKLIKLSVMMSAVLHELQKERGASAGFLGSKGTKFTDILPKQHSSTDIKIKELKDYISLNNFKEAKEVSQNIPLDTVPAMREKVKSLSTKTSSAVKFYTAMNKKIIDEISNFSTLPNDRKLRTNFNSIAVFVTSKERAGIERAVLSGVFAKDSFNRATIAKFASLVQNKKHLQTFLCKLQILR